MSYANARLTGEIKRDGTFPVRGLTGSEMSSVFKCSLVGGSALAESVRVKGTRDDAVARRDGNWLLAVHMIHQYLRQGLPVIMILDCWKLYPAAKEQLNLKGIYSTQDELAHAVVVVGAKFRRERRAISPSPDAFVYHDPQFGPYLEKPILDLIFAGRFEKDPKVDPEEIAFLVPVPRGVVAKLSEVWECMLLCAYGKRELPQKHFGPLSRPPSVAHQFSLVNRENIADTYFSTSSAKVVKGLLQKNLSYLPE
jgi:hypothetical protein